MYEQEKYKTQLILDQRVVTLILVEGGNPFLGAENATARIRKAGGIGKQLRDGACEILKCGLGELRGTSTCPYVELFEFDAFSSGWEKRGK